MAALKQFVALSLSVSLIAAQGQDACAAVLTTVPTRIGATMTPMGSPTGSLAAPSLEAAFASPSLSPALSGTLPTLDLALPSQAGAPATASAPAAIPASASLPSRAAQARSVSASRISLPALKPVPAPARASLAVLNAAVGTDSPAARPGRARSAESSARIAVMFDGGTRGFPAANAADPVRAKDPISARTFGLTRPLSAEPEETASTPAPKAPTTGKKALSRWRVLKENRFLISAAAGAALGLAGVNLGTLPVLSLMPGLFFGVLPWLAAPFIGLNIYSSFAHHSVIKESRTLVGFLVITLAGLAISAGVTMAMTSLLPVVDPASFAAAAIPGLSEGGFSPMQFMLPIIGIFTAAALLYKRARAAADGSARRDYPPGWKGSVLKFYDAVVGLAINGRTAPALVKAGELGEKATGLINKIFPRFIDLVGLPAVATLLSMSMATGGLGLLHSFGGYYITAFAGMAVGLLALLAAYFAFGARAKDFKEILKAALVGFSLSSSSATMPTEKEALKAIGVSKKTRNSVVPLGGVFNMYGTALYMGLTAFYALSMFGAAPTMMQYFNTALAVLVIAMGAPGIPASNITLLEPVLRQTGLASGQVTQVYTMILPGDRILDMAQTALNVVGDMLPAVEQDRKRLRYVRAKRIRELRRKRGSNASGF